MLPTVELIGSEKMNPEHKSLGQPQLHSIQGPQSKRRLGAPSHFNSWMINLFICSAWRIMTIRSQRKRVAWDDGDDGLYDAHTLGQLFKYSRRVATSVLRTANGA